MSRRTFLAALLASVGGAAAAGFNSDPRPHRGRVIVVHGLNTTAALYRSTSPFNTLEHSLAEQNWAVHTIPITGEGTGTTQATNLQTQFNADTTGANARSQWLTDYDTYVAGLPTVDGPTVVLGISWGGLLALQAAGRASTLPDAFMAHLPACDPNFLTEFTTYTLTALADLNEAAMTMPGYISWATDDTRVGYTDAKTLAQTTLGCDWHEYTSLGHVTDLEVVRNLLAWADAL